MKTWKTDDSGAIVLKDGDPVFIDSAGNEMVVSSDTISRLNGEAMTHRKEKENLQIKLKEFEGIDPVVAKKSIEIAGKLDAKQLIDAGKVDEVKKQITDQFTAQLNEQVGMNKTLQGKIENMLIDGVFANSEFVNNNLAIPRDIFKDSFAKHFKVEDGQVVAFDKAGNKLYSKKKAGEYADTEEAIQLLVESHPQKDSLLKADVGAGSGSKGGGNNRPGRAMTRDEFSKLPPNKQAETALKMRSGEMLPLTD